MLTLEFKEPFKLGIYEWDESNTTESIEIQKPNGTVSDHLAELEEQQGFAYANAMKMSDKVSISEEQMKELQSTKDEDSDKKEESEIEILKKKEEEASALVTQMVIGGASMKVCYRVMKKILSTGSNRATINGDKIIDKNIVDLIPHDELKRVLGHYILNFTNILD